VKDVQFLEFRCVGNDMFSVEGIISQYGKLGEQN